MQLLREQLVPGRVGAVYFSIDQIEAWLAAKGAKVSHGTLLGYMHDLMRSGQVNGAGRGWYTFLNNRPVLDKEAVAPVLQAVRPRFPLLRMAAWSTAQVNPWMHHLIGTPTVFLSVEKEAMPAVAEHLAEAGWKVALNPRGEETRRFSIVPRGVVVRPTIDQMIPELPDNQASPEQLLVDLRLEVEPLGLMSVSEFRAMATRMATGARLNLG